MTAPTIRAQLAQAVRVINLAHGQLTEEEQDQVEIVPDADIDLALATDDYAEALTLIARWRDRQLRAIHEASS